MSKHAKIMKSHDFIEGLEIRTTMKSLADRRVHFGAEFLNPRFSQLLTTIFSAKLLNQIAYEKI